MTCSNTSNALLDGGLVVPWQERGVGRDPDEPAPLGDEPHLVVGLVAGMVEEGDGAAVGKGDRHRGVADRVLRRLRPDVGEVHQHPDPVHLVDDVAAEVGEPAVARLPAPAPDEVLGVVGELHDPHPEGREDLHEVGPILEGGGVLPPEDDPDPPLALGPLDVVRVLHLGEEVAVLPEPALPLRDVLHRSPEAFPHRAGAVDGGEPAPVHGLEDIAAPAADDEAVDDDRVFVQLSRFVHVPHFRM